MGSPIDKWEGAAAVFTGATSSFSIGLFLAIAVVLTLAPVIHAARHETHIFKKHS